MRTKFGREDSETITVWKSEEMWFDPRQCKHFYFSSREFRNFLELKQRHNQWASDSVAQGVRVLWPEADQSP